MLFAQLHVLLVAFPPSLLNLHFPKPLCCFSTGPFAYLLPRVTRACLRISMSACHLKDQSTSTGQY